MERNASGVPDTIGRFRIDERLGAGGMGDVYKGFDPSLKRHVAVKTVRVEMEGPEFIERLYREAQACARLQHPHIVTVYEVGEFSGGVFIAMEYLKGQSLSAAIADGRLLLRDKLTILVQILDALTHAHEEQVIHRDIKPRNVHLLPDGSIKLLDFGLARVESTDPITRTGLVMGTPHYASPEQLRAERVDARSDIFSMGALAYELLEGTRPFEGDSISAVLIKVLSDPPAAARGAWRDAFPELELILQRALAKSPDERFQSARDMRVALEVLLQSQRVRLAAFDDGVVQQRAERADASTVVRLPGSLAKETATLPPSLPASGASSLSPPATRRGGVLPIAAGVAVVLIAVVAYALVGRRPDAASGREPASRDAAVAGSALSSAALVPTASGTTPASSGGVSPAAPPAAAVSVAASAPTREVVPPVPPAPPALADVASAPGGDVSAGTFDLRRLFAPGTASAPYAGLRWRLVQKLESGDEVSVDPRRVFKAGDRVRLVLDPSVDGFLNVAMRGPSRPWTLVFPGDGVSGANVVTRGRSYQVPDNGWLDVDTTPGVDELFVVLSTQRLADTLGFKGRGRRAGGFPPRAVEELRQRFGRNLVFEMDRPGPSASGRAAGEQVQYVANRDEPSTGVAMTVRLRHER